MACHVRRVSSRTIEEGRRSFENLGEKGGREGQEKGKKKGKSDKKDGEPGVEATAKGGLEAPAITNSTEEQDATVNKLVDGVAQITIPSS
jgi:hypothetical protein